MSLTNNIQARSRQSRVGKIVLIAIVFGGLAICWLASWYVENVRLHQVLKLFVAGLCALTLLTELMLPERRAGRSRRILWWVAISANVVIFIVQQCRGSFIP